MDMTQVTAAERNPGFNEPLIFSAKQQTGYKPASWPFVAASMEPVVSHRNNKPNAKVYAALTWCFNGAADFSAEQRAVFVVETL